jgi:hypothetical protein
VGAGAGLGCSTRSNDSAEPASIGEAPNDDAGPPSNEASDRGPNDGQDARADDDRVVAPSAAADDPAPSGGTGGGAASTLQTPSGGTSGAVSGGPGVSSPGGGNSGGDATKGQPGESGPVDADALGAHPVETSPLTRGGTMTFTNVGAPGWWPRRIERNSDGARCDYQDGTDTWGGDCCMTRHETESSTLSPFDEEMTLIVKAIDVRQLAIYQPGEASAAAPWRRVTAWDARTGGDNLWFTDAGDGCADFPGDLTHDVCLGYVSQQPLLECGSDLEYYCPDDPGMLHQGYSGSKLVVLLGSMPFDDAGVQSCSGDGPGHPGPWMAFVASELIRDGGRKWNGLCNCYSKDGSVGDGCGEINVFEVVMDDNEFSNREFASTGVRSYQAGHVGGSVCTRECERGDFPADADVVDACGRAGYEQGPVIEIGGDSDGCPVWLRPEGDRYFFILLDETERMIQVGMLHPESLPDAAPGLLPDLASTLDRGVIDALLALRLPG